MSLPPLKLIPGEYHPRVWANEAEMHAITEHNMQVLHAKMEANGEFDFLDDPICDDDLDI